ncbi:MAG: hypothetical protein ACFCUM_17765, partial [Bacteroidales bacterium]
KTFEEYNEALNTVLSMSKDERKSYEESKGYISFGRKCDESYDEIDFDEFESLEDIKAFAASNDFIAVIEDYDGEIIFEKTLATNRNRYFINSDRLFQIGDLVYKAFEDGTAATHISNIHKLAQIKSNSVYTVPEDAEIIVSNITKDSSNLKDAAYNCGTYFYDGKTNGDFRLGIGVEREQVNSGSILGGDAFTTLYAGTFIKVFRKKGFGWAYSNRQVQYTSKVAVDIQTASGWEREFHKTNGDHGVDGIYSKTFIHRWLSSGYHYPYAVHFGAYDGYARLVVQDFHWQIQCNTNIFPWGY